LLDCGKTFREAALKWFPQKGLRRIDACILTRAWISRYYVSHPAENPELADLHADAIDGLDDLRAWTYKSAIEKTIPIYCTRTTYDAIAAGFPYMISKAAASGGGALPSFDWQ
jgi:phosphoribosyl 1,2-cyclic phosphodiesterase